MMFPSHLLATLLLAGILHHVRPLAPQEWILALAFGVAIDLDHLVQMPVYVASQGWQALTPATMLHWGARWQGFMHTPWALLVVAAFAILFKSWAPPVFWGLHMVQDFVVATRYVRFGSLEEWGIVGVLAFLVAALFAWEWRASGAQTALWRHALARFGVFGPK